MQQLNANLFFNHAIQAAMVDIDRSEVLSRVLAVPEYKVTESLKFNTKDVEEVKGQSTTSLLFYLK